jgi:hypothetical protein
MVCRSALKTQNPAVLGLFERTIQPFMMTTGNIDMDHASVFFSERERSGKTLSCSDSCFDLPELDDHKLGKFSSSERC